MEQRDHSVFAQARLAALIADRLAGARIANGTPLADAVMSALAVDVRKNAQGSWAGLENLTGDRLEALGAEVQTALGREGEKFALPLGSRVVSKVCGLGIGGETWLMDAGRPGLHALETMRGDAHGPNLELLRQEIAKMTEGTELERIGLPLPESAPSDQREMLWFLPFDEAGGVVLQRLAQTGSPRFCASTPEMVRDFAKSVVTNMQALSSCSDAIGKRVRAVREAADAYAAQLPGVTVDAVGIDLQVQSGEAGFDLYVYFLGPGDAHRPGRILDYVDGRHGIEDGYRGPISLGRRFDDIEELRSLGADAWIDDMAAAILPVVPGGADALLARLREEHELTVAITSGATPCYAGFFWNNGTIQAEVVMPGRLDQFGSGIEIHNASLPETVVATIEDRRLGEIVDLPFDCTSPIMGHQKQGDGFRLHLAIENRLIDLTSGRIWDYPRAAR